MSDLQPTPYTVAIDTREVLPYEFATPLRWPNRKHPFTVATVRKCLSSGDYSMLGFESAVACERKSMADLFSTLGQGRRRFTLELERLATYQYAAVVVEAEVSDILTAPPRHSKLNPKSVFMSVVSWSMAFPAVHWFFVPGRAVGEATTARILDMWWRRQWQHKCPDCVRS